MQYIQEAIDFYSGRSCVPEIDYTLQCDGSGVYIKQWNVQDKGKPTLLQLQTIANNLAPSIQLELLRQEKMEENQTNYESVRNGVKVINGVSINIDPVSCMNITGQVLLVVVNRVSGGSPLSITWYCDNNHANIYSEEEFLSLGNTVAGIIFLVQQKLSANKIAIADATLVELQNIDTDYNTL